MLHVRHIKGQTNNNAMSEEGINAYPHQIVGQEVVAASTVASILVLWPWRPLASSTQESTEGDLVEKCQINK